MKQLERETKLNFKKKTKAGERIVKPLSCLWWTLLESLTLSVVVKHYWASLNTELGVSHEHHRLWLRPSGLPQENVFRIMSSLLKCLCFPLTLLLACSLSGAQPLFRPPTVISGLGCRELGTICNIHCMRSFWVLGYLCQQWGGGAGISC